MASLFGSPTWADSILDGEREGSFGPYFLNEEIGRLMPFEEIRRDPVEGYEPSPGWQPLAKSGSYTVMLWASPRLPEIFHAKKLRRVILPEGAERLSVLNDWSDAVRLYISGDGFFFEEDFYLLPKKLFKFNIFNYKRPGKEPLQVFVGYRGHSHSYSQVLTPSALRDTTGDYLPKYLEYKAREGYAGNLLREAYWRYGHRILQDLQAYGILQHHKAIGDTDILDLSYEPDVAKLFALSDLTPAGNYVAKSWTDVEDYSCIYKVVVRVIGGTSEPIDLPPYSPLNILPFNICPLSSATEVAARDCGFGVWAWDRMIATTMA
jgi:hypothetical protein